MFEGPTKWLRGAIAASACLLATSASAQTTITFWNGWDGSRRPQLRAVLDEFERRNPDIKVESVTLSSDTTAQRFLTAVASGAVPDLYMTQAGDFSRWASLGAFLPLDDLVRRDRIDLDAVFFGSSIEGSRVGGKLLQFPFKVATSMLVWYNKSIFRQAGLDPDKPPTTWTEFEDAVRRTTVRNGNTIDRLGFNVCLNCSMGTGSENPFVEWISRNGGSILSPDGRSVAFDSQAGIDTLKWMVDFSNRTSGSWGNVLRQYGATWKDLRTSFYTGKMAMIHDGPFLYNIMANDAPQMLDNVGVFVTPINGANPAASQRYIGYGVPGYGIPAKARNPEAAWRLLKFLAMEDAGACEFFRQQKRADTPLKACKVELPPTVAAAFVKNAELVEGHAAPGIWSQIHARLQQMSESALLGQQTPEAAIRAAADDVRRLLARNTN
jgi:multiple sugar transport system substrate-binding protein